MKQNVIVWSEGQNYINDLIADYPNTRRYYEWVAQRLCCEVEDIVMLAPNPKFSDDEEGWDLESFFTPEQGVVKILTHKDVDVEGFAIGEVEEIMVGHNIYLAEHNASPWLMYANPESIQEVGRV